MINLYSPPMNGSGQSNPWSKRLCDPLPWESIMQLSSAESDEGTHRIDDAFVKTYIRFQFRRMSGPLR